MVSFFSLRFLGPSDMLMFLGSLHFWFHNAFASKAPGSGVEGEQDYDDNQVAWQREAYRPSDLAKKLVKKLANKTNNIASHLS